MTKNMQQIRSRRFGATGILVTTLIVVITSGSLLGIYFIGGGEAGDESKPDIYAVHSGGFKITIPASGELAALQQVEISSGLEGRAVITEIVDEGVMVEKGDILIRLNDEDIKTRIDDSENDVTTAENALVGAETVLEGRMEARDSALAEANLRIRLAELSLEGWEQGDLVSQRQRLALNIEIAEKDYERLRDVFEQSGELRKQNFISEDDYRRDEISMIRSRAALKEAKLASEVYETYTYEQDRAVRESEVQQAKDEQKRTANRFESEIRGAESAVNKQKYNLKHRQERLAKWQHQLELCVIPAPSAGLVVYTTSISTGGHMGRSNQDPPDVGTEISRNRPIIILPDTSVMVAEVKVNEALSGQIKPGQRATIRSDALPDATFHGKVLSIGVLAEGGGWRDPNRRDYTVRIQLEDIEGLGLKPSMRCQAEIFVGQVDDTPYIPVQAVFRNGPTAFVYVPERGGYGQTAIHLGRASELFVGVTEGLAEGQLVLLREPGLEEIMRKLPEQENASRSGRGPGRGMGKPSGQNHRPSGKDHSRGSSSGQKADQRASSRPAERHGKK